MDKKKFAVLLVVMNLLLVLCLVVAMVFLFSGKSGKAEAPAAPANVASTAANDANSQPQVSKPAVKPEDIIACFGIGKEQRRLKAMEDIGQVMRSEPPYLGELTEVYRNAKNGKWDEALGICNYHIQYSENKQEAIYSLAWVYAKQGRLKEAVEKTGELTTNYPSFVKSYSLSGWLAAKEGRNDEALAACTKIISLAPDNAMGYYGQGRLYSVLDKPAEAIASYSNAIKIKPDYAEVYLFLGLVYARQGQWPDALKAFNNAVSADRGYEQGYLFLAVAYDELAMYREETEALVQAIGMSTLRSNTKEQWHIFGVEPDYARFNCRLAEAYARIGEYHKAVLSCKDAVDINPAYPEAYYNMALAHLLLGEKKLAIEQRDKLKALKAPDMLAKLDEVLR